MTLKHVKFEDSVTMRSLEKVAREKGWVQSEPIEKTANKKNDYSVTSNLTENVIKLCTGLRNSGFNKYADELESKFMAYKKADSMYDTTGEKGEDLVDAAHPHGSHKLEGVDGDSVIETILDQQLKDIEMVNKHPHGKLSSHQIIDQVKVVLAQNLSGAREIDLSGSLWNKLVNLFPGKAAPLELATETGAAGEAAAGTAAGVGAAAIASVALAAAAGLVAGNAIFEHKFYATDLVKAGNNLLSEIEDVETSLGQEAHVTTTAFKNKLESIKAKSSVANSFLADPNPNNLQAIQDYINTVQDASNFAAKLMSIAANDGETMAPGTSKKESFWHKLVAPFSGNADVEATASNFINVAQKALGDARFAVNEIYKIMRDKAAKSAPAAPVATNAVSKFKEYIAKSSSSIDKYIDILNVRSPENKDSLVSYLNGLKDYFKQLNDSFATFPPEKQANVYDEYVNKAAPAIRDLNRFYTSYIAAKS